jgi:hypothetical protein
VQVSYSVSTLAHVEVGSELTNLDAIEGPANQMKVSNDQTTRTFAYRSLCVFCKVKGF